MMVKKLRIIIVSILLGWNFLGGGLGLVAAQEPTIDESQPIVIGLDNSFAPFGFVEDGKYKGFDVELAKEVFDKLGLEYRFQPIDWSVKEMELINGNIDALWNAYAITPERAAQVAFSDVYLEGDISILVKADSPFYTKADLAGKKVATQEGSMQLEKMREDPEFLASLDGEVVTFATFNEVLSDLEADRVDAAVVSELATRYTFLQNGKGDQYRMLEEGFGTSELAVGFRKSDTVFLEKFNAALAEVMADQETYDEIYSHWFATLGSEGEVEAQKNSLWKPLLQASKTTLYFFACTLVASVPLGLVIALLEFRGPKWFKAIVQVYVYVFRGTPLLLQIMFVYFGLPFIGFTPGRVESALLTMIINYAAYLVEIFRGGLNAIPNGQYETLKVLSIPTLKGYRHVILPQLWQTVLPSVGNEVISLVKDTSLIYVIGLDELSKVGRALSNQHASMLPFAYVAVIYLLMTGVVTLALRYLERKIVN